MDAPAGTQGAQRFLIGPRRITCHWPRFLIGSWSVMPRCAGVNATIDGKKQPKKLPAVFSTKFFFQKPQIRH